MVDYVGLVEDVFSTVKSVRSSSERNRGCNFVVYAGHNEYMAILKEHDSEYLTPLGTSPASWQFCGWPLVAVSKVSHWHVAAIL